jgi:hypothetical protein
MGCRREAALAIRGMRAHMQALPSARARARVACRAARAWRGLRSAALRGSCWKARPGEVSGNVRTCERACSAAERNRPGGAVPRGPCCTACIGHRRRGGQAARKAAARRCTDGSVAGRRTVLAAERCAPCRPEPAVPMHAHVRTRARAHARACACACAHARTHATAALQRSCARPRPRARTGQRGGA